MRKRWTRLGAGLLAVVGLVGCWPEPGGGPGRTGHNAAETSITIDSVESLGVAWSAPIGQPRVANARTLLASTTSTLSAVRLSDGAVRWTKPQTLSLRYPWSAPILSGDRVLRAVAVGNWDAHEFDELTGAEVGTVVDGRIESVRGDRRLREGYTQEQGGLLTWFRVDDPAHPDASWGGTTAHTTDLSAYSDLTFGADRVYASGVGLMSGTPGDAAQGDAVRSYAAGAPATCGPSGDWPCPVWVTTIPELGFPPEVTVGAGETSVYLTTGGGTLYALDAATGAVQWSATVGSSVSRPAVADGVVYVGTGDGRVLAFDAAGCGAPTCAPTWDAPVGGATSGQPAVAGGVVFVGTTAGSVVALDAAGCGATSCAPVWSATVGTGAVGSPIVAAGTLVVGTSSTTVALRPASAG